MFYLSLQVETTANNQVSTSVRTPELNVNRQVARTAPNERFYGQTIRSYVRTFVYINT